MMFESVIGHENVKQRLENSIASNKISHAYIFAGKRGVGKKTVANIFADILTNGSVADVITVTNDDGLALYGSKNLYIRKRAKGTERSDLADQDDGGLREVVELLHVFADLTHGLLHQLGAHGQVGTLLVAGEEGDDAFGRGHAFGRHGQCGHERAA